MTGQRQAITPPPHNGQESVVSSSSSSVDVGFIVKEAHPGTDRRPQPASVATVPQTSSYKYCTTEGEFLYSPD
jgi:hypothetical protein